MNSDNILLLGLKQTVTAISKYDGRTLWTTELPTAFSGDNFVTVLSDGEYVFAHTEGKLHCLDLANGQVQWSNDLKGYGYGIAFRTDGSGNYYAFVIQDHAVAIDKWVGNGDRVQGSPPPVSTSAVHADVADRLQAICATIEGGRAVHLELWVNGKKLVDFTDRNHPYTKGYLGLLVQSSMSGTQTTTEAEFDNFAAAQL